jgi:predicted ATPase
MEPGPTTDALAEGQLRQACSELDRHMRAGLPCRAEDLLAARPALAAHPDCALELVYTEFLLRAELGPPPSPAEWYSRFPQWSDRLRRVFQIHDQLGVEATKVGGGPPPAPQRGLPPAPAGYELLGLLGGGGMGVVYKARQLRLNRLVALKLLRPDRPLDPDALARFHREALAASALNHPYICTVHDLGEHDGRPFIVMELVEGTTLQALTGKPLNLDVMRRLIGQVAGALAMAHAAGVVHRDVKPENVIVRPDGYVKVLDFGLARLLPGGAAAVAFAGKETDPGTQMGTILYMSPEQARAEPVGSASDIFSLGIVLYELATGRHPFEADSGFGIQQAILVREPVSPGRLNPELGAALSELIEQMLAKDPRLRPTAAEVEAALRAGSAGGAIAPKAAAAPAPAVGPTVGRTREFQALRDAFASASGGRGMLLCVTGEAGLGKTTVVERFLHDLMAGGEAPAVGRGHCSERLAGAEGYLPLLEALESLVHGDGRGSAARALKGAAPTWYVRVTPPAPEDDSWVRLAADARSSSQERINRELSGFLAELSALWPVVLFLDDVHWADASTVDLLAYLGGRCADLRLLLVLTYRPTEMLLGQHPFLQVQRELQARGLCREVPLGFLGRQDIERYLALTFPRHHLPADLAALIHGKTEGNPLFMVALLRDLQQRGVIAEEQGRWVLAQAVPDLEADLPESVRALLRRKTDQLDEADRRLLVAASVQGHEFDAAVVARALGRDAAEVEERLEVLDRVHGFVRRLREHELPDGTLTLRFAFVHVLYQDTLHARLQPARRAALSAAVAQALLGHYGEGNPAVAADLALLFESARDFGRAADQFLLAAQNSARVFAHKAAAVWARRGLSLMRALPDTPERARRELGLQMTLGLQLQIIQGFADPEVEKVYTRARELCERLGETSQLFPVLWGLWLFHKGRSQLSRAWEMAEELFRLAQQVEDPALLLQSHQALAVTSLCRGEPATTREHMERGTALYDPGRHHGQTLLFGQDPGAACLAFGALALWLLGFPDQARARMHEADRLSRDLAQPSTRALVLHFASMLAQCLREPAAVREAAEANLVVSTEQGFSFWRAGGLIMRGWALVEEGLIADGAVQLRQGLFAWRVTGSETYRTYYLALLAEVLGKEGETQAGLDTLAEALALADATGERYYEAELHRLKGEFLLRQAAGDGAEACFREAAGVARRQAAQSLELRAAMSLARLFRTQGRAEEARPVLAEVYGRFTEGRDTPDLLEAGALLEGLA